MSIIYSQIFKDNLLKWFLAVWLSSKTYPWKYFAFIIIYFNLFKSNLNFSLRVHASRGIPTDHVQVLQKIFKSRFYLWKAYERKNKCSFSLVAKIQKHTKILISFFHNFGIFTPPPPKIKMKNNFMYSGVRNIMTF